MVGYGPHPPHPHWARRRADSGSVRAQLRRGSREQRPGRGRGFGNISVGNDSGRGISESTHEHGIAVRVRLTGRVVACTANLRAAKPASHGLCGGAGDAAEPEAVSAFQELGHEIACHGLRWKSYQSVDIERERADMAEAVQILRDLTGSAPLGWYTGRDSPNTRELVVEHVRLRLRLRFIRRRSAVLGRRSAWRRIGEAPGRSVHP